ncbi:hypothetical protein BU24DRAFT_493560 [Aaosphaeria arxii CBS 175.79]|uniref:Protein kinase domain-containing protein n=1 Tax=Aaosphaeria arxii CBS 175.79 TaxID=1450172 RepID=A0A6A5XQI7_9PLEO|nr:uncharacterized protein BU24DRAFT_493560 [Aaosphaeria arxii CBS 175.79]KAF2015097.1 hypothetical protein BU24DRAFT_493560 [Aaosphaeria arxii CBS 175.79]
MEVLSNSGRTSIIYTISDTLVWKTVRRSPLNEKFTAENEHAALVEQQLLHRLGTHPSIIQYHGRREISGKQGLLFTKANLGDLQSYLDNHNSTISDTTGVAVGVLLADFGGSRCLELSLDGHLLPDFPFSHPQVVDDTSPVLDLFSLGVLMYIIMTGHFPFHTGASPRNEEFWTYQEYVEQKYLNDEFPDLEGIMFGDVIEGCCRERRFRTADEVVEAMKAEMEDVFMNGYSEVRAG